MALDATVTAPWLAARAPRMAAYATAACVAVLVVTGQLLSPRTAGVDDVLAGGMAVSFSVLGALVVVHSRGNRVGQLMLTTGLTATAAALALSFDTWVVASWAAQWAWFPPLGILLLSLLVFPDGHFPSRRWRHVGRVVAVGTVVTSLLLAVAAVGAPWDLMRETDLSRLPALSRALRRVAIFTGGAVLLSALAVLGSLVLRWRRATGDARLQLACLALAVPLLIAGQAVMVAGHTYAWLPASVAVPAGMAAAILLYRLYDLDVYVSRAVVWTVMTTLVVGAYAGVVTLVGDQLLGAASRALFLATALIAVAFEPVRARVQRTVERALFGDRDQPYEALSRLGRILESTVDPNAVLDRLPATVADSVRVPWAAIELAGDRAEQPRARGLREHGRRLTPAERFPLVAHGQHVGELLVGRRTATDHFSRRERRLLSDLASQAAVAAEATRLTRDLQHARERLVLSREEERRRLRRDLHDGVGPSLAGMSMQVRALRRRLPDGGEPAAMLRAIEEDLRACTVDVRHLVDELRPAVLDHGLETALARSAGSLSSADFTVTVEVSGRTTGLPAAVEVAAFRIATEAMTNALRHAGARSCRVSVHGDGALRLTVDDDGGGLQHQRRDGVGLRSMRERAEELGGSCTVGPGPAGGTRVEALLPIPLGAVPGAAETPALAVAASLALPGQRPTADALAEPPRAEA